MLDIELQGEQVKLLPERALWWPLQKTLIVSDLHWGKSAHFRKNGIPMPLSTQPQDEMRLAKLIQQHQAERLIIAGDLFHSKQNNEVDNFGHWRRSHKALHIDMVVGNHDILPAQLYEQWDMQMHKKGYHTGPFYIAHNVIKDDTLPFIIHGHVHPAIKIHGKAYQSIKLCCFCEDEHRFILPAFGQFTGNYLLQADEHKHLYVIVEGSVMKWK